MLWNKRSASNSTQMWTATLKIFAICAKHNIYHLLTHSLRLASSRIGNLYFWWARWEDNKILTVSSYVHICLVQKSKLELVLCGVRIVTRCAVKDSRLGFSFTSAVCSVLGDAVKSTLSEDIPHCAHEKWCPAVICIDLDNDFRPYPVICPYQ
jgi:hypothetical protein